MQLAHLAGREAPLAVVQDGRVAPLADRVGIATVDELIASGVDVADAATQALAEAQPLQPGMLARPLLAPGNIACVGLNYEDHIRETGLDRPERPLIFAKLTSSLLGPDEEIRWPAGLTTSVDWEAELAVVIGRRMSGVSVDDALDHAFGYTAANDVSARDLQKSDGQWGRAKGYDTFCPVGPAVRNGLDWRGLEVIGRVNGQERQRAAASGMHFPIPTLVSFISGIMTLEPGDLIATGTPAGVGPLHDGDVVEVEIPGVGVLSNPVRDGTQ